MDYFLNENDLFDDEAGVEVLYLLKAGISYKAKKHTTSHYRNHVLSLTYSNILLLTWHRWKDRAIPLRSLPHNLRLGKSFQHQPQD